MVYSLYFTFMYIDLSVWGIYVLALFPTVKAFLLPLRTQIIQCKACLKIPIIDKTHNTLNFLCKFNSCVSAFGKMVEKVMIAVQLNGLLYGLTQFV